MAVEPSAEPAGALSTDQRLALLLRAVQRVEHAVAPTADLEARLEALTETVDDQIAALRGEVAALSANPPPEKALAHLIQALRTELSTGLADNRAELSRLRAELDARSVRLSETVAGVRSDTSSALESLRAAMAARAAEVPALPAAPATQAALEGLASSLGDVRDDVRRLHGELVVGTGQFRTDLAASSAELKAELVQTLEAKPVGGVDRVFTAIRELGEELEGLLEGNETLRGDLRRSVERVLGAIDHSERSVSGQVRALDGRLTGLADDVRAVRALRDGLEALGSGIEGIRQLASRSATSAQLADVTRELQTVLTEIEAARSQVLAVDSAVSRVQAEVVDVTSPKPRPEVLELADSVARLEKEVGGDVEALGERIERLAASLEQKDDEAGDLTETVVRSLRKFSTSARALGAGVREDLRRTRARR